MDNILVKFAADVAELQPGVDGLVQLEVVDKKVADQAKKTQQAIRDRDKAITDGAKASKASVEQLANSMQALDKSIAGGAMKNALSSLVSQLKLTSEESKKFYQLLQSNAKVEILNAQTTEELDILNSLLREAEENLAQFGNEAENTDKKATSFRAQLRALKASMQELEDAGKDDSEAFRKMQVEAAKLEDQIGDTNQRIKVLASDTFVFDSLVGAAQGVTAAFSIAQGATALFGAENEELQKGILKVQGAMALLQGIQQVQMLLQKQSVVYLGVENALRRISALSTGLQSAAESNFVVVRYSAIAAQRVLNAVMAANPAGVLLVTLGAVAAMLTYFTSKTDEAAEAQKRLNEQMQFQLDLTNKYAEAVKRAGEKNIADLQKNNATAKEIRAAEINSLNNQLAEFKRFDEDRAKSYEDAQEKLRNASKLDLSEEQIKELETTRKSYEANQEKIFETKHAIDLAMLKDEGETRKESLSDHTAYVNAKLAKTVQGSREELVATIASIRAQESEAVSTGGKTAAQIAQVRAEADRKVAELRNQIRNYDLQQDLFLAQAKVEAAKKGSVQELQARKQQLDAEAALELNKLGITEAQKKAINAKLASDQKALDQQIAITTIQLQDATNSARLAKAKEGSKEELALKLQALKNERDIAVVNAGEVTEKVYQIDEEYQKKRRDLTKQYNQKIAEDAINSRISGLNTELAELEVANESATSSRLLQVKQNLVDEQAALEVVSIENTEHNEELRRLKIQAVYARALADKEKLERDKIAAEIQFTQDIANGQLQLELEKNNRLAASQTNSLNVRHNAEKEAFVIRRQMLDNEEAATDQRYAEGIISYEDYQRKLLEIAGKYAQLDYEQTEAAEMKKKAIRDQVLDLSSQFTLAIGNALFENTKAQLEEESKINEDQKNKKLISEEGYNRRVREMNVRKAKSDRQQALFNIGINTAVAVSKAIAESPLTFGLPFSAFAAAQGVIQAAAVLLKPLPQFRRGKVKINGIGTETSDDNLVRISKNESVINAEMTRKHEAALRAINDNRFESYLASLPMPGANYRQYEPVATQELAAAAQTTLDIDYDKLGQSVAKYVGRFSDMPSYHVNIDKDGISLIVSEALSQTEFVNNRYSTK